MSPSLQTMGFFMSDLNFCNTKEQLNHLGEVVTGKVDGSPTGADIDTSTLPYTGQARRTLPALESEYEQSIANKEAEADAAIDSYRLLNKGPYASGIALESKFEYITYNGESYFAVNPPYTTTATNPDADANLFLGGYTTFENVANKIGNKNELSNSNFLTPSPEDITHPNATPETYAAGTQIFSGVYAGDNGCTVTFIDGRVNCTAGDYQFKAPSTGGLERVPVFTSSVSDYDGIPKITGVSHALVGDEYVVTVTPAAGDVFSVKLEQGSVATGHEVGSLSAGNISDYTDIVFDNIASMVAGNPIPPKTGDMVRVNGFYEINDGGGGDWFTVPAGTKTDGVDGWHEGVTYFDNSDVQFLPFAGNSVKLKSLGMKLDGTGESERLQKIVDWCEGNGFGYIDTGAGVYGADGEVMHKTSIHFRGRGENKFKIKALTSNINVFTNNPDGNIGNSRIEHVYFSDMSADLNGQSGTTIFNFQKIQRGGLYRVTGDNEVYSDTDYENEPPADSYFYRMYGGEQDYYNAAEDVTVKKGFDSGVVFGRAANNGNMRNVNVNGCNKNWVWEDETGGGPSIKEPNQVTLFGCSSENARERDLSIGACRELWVFGLRIENNLSSSYSVTPTLIYTGQYAQNVFLVGLRLAYTGSGVTVRDYYDDEQVTEWNKDQLKSHTPVESSAMIGRRVVVNRTTSSESKYNGQFAMSIQEVNDPTEGFDHPSSLLLAGESVGDTGTQAILIKTEANDGVLLMPDGSIKMLTLGAKIWARSPDGTKQGKLEFRDDGKWYATGGVSPA